MPTNNNAFVGLRMGVEDNFIQILRPLVSTIINSSGQSVTVDMRSSYALGVDRYPQVVVTAVMPHFNPRFIGSAYDNWPQTSPALPIQVYAQPMENTEVQCRIESTNYAERAQISDSLQGTVWWGWDSVNSQPVLRSLVQLGLTMMGNSADMLEDTMVDVANASPLASGLKVYRNTITFYTRTLFMVNSFSEPTYFTSVQLIDQLNKNNTDGNMPQPITVNG